MEPRTDEGSAGRLPDRLIRGATRPRLRSARDVLAQWLAAAGLRTDGSRAWDLRVNDQRLWNRLLADGSLGFGEAYMDGWWDAERIDELVTRAMYAAID